MKNICKMSITKLLTVFNTFEAYGIKKEKVLESLDINSSVLESPDNKLTADKINLLFLEAAKLTNNVNIGLHMGENLSKGFSNIIGYLLMNCATLEHASEKYCAYEKVVDETCITSVQVQDSFAIVSINIADKTLLNNKPFLDYKLSGFVSYMRILTGKRINISEVHFTYGKPQNISEYEQIFQCPVYFEQAVNLVVFDKFLLNLHVIEPNKNLLDIFEKEAQKTLNSLECNQTYTEKVKHIILKEFNGKTPMIKTVAKELALSVRSLQTYLNIEQTSFTIILNEARKDIALYFLADKKASIDEIAYIVGFSETSAFHRAFKRWTNLTPNEFRATLINS